MNGRSGREPTGPNGTGDRPIDPTSSSSSATGGVVDLCARRSLRPAAVDDEQDLDAVANLVAAVRAQNDARLGPAPVGLIGRPSLGAEIDHLVARHRGGNGSLVLITGEFGSGKSALARHLCSLLAAQGAVVGWSQAIAKPGHSVSGGQPLRAWAHGVGALLGHLDPEIRRALGGRPELQPLAVLGPSVAAWLGLRDGGQVPTDTADVMLCLLALLREVSRRQPVALMLDDLHRADRDSIALVELAATSLARQPVALIAAWRPGQGETPDREAALANLAHHSGACRFNLGPLSPADIGEMARSMGVSPGADELTRVHRRSGGNPLLAGELLRRPPVVPPGPDDLGSKGPVPNRPPEFSPVLVETVMAVAGANGEPTMALLRLASLYRRPFNAFDLAAVHPLDRNEIDRRLGEATATGLLAAVEGPGVNGPSGRHVFVHPVVAEVLAGRFRPAERAEQHGRIGRALAAGGAQHFEVAYHLSRSADLGDQLEALSIALSAFRAGLGVELWFELDRIVSRCLPATTRPNASHLRCQVHLYRAWRALVTGSRDRWRAEADRGLDLAIELAETLGEPVSDETRALLTEAMLTAVGSSPLPRPIGSVAITPAEAAHLVPRLDRALELAGDTPDTVACRVHRLGLTALASTSSPGRSASVRDRSARQARRLIGGTGRRSGRPAGPARLAYLEWFSSHRDERNRSEFPGGLPEFDNITSAPGLVDRWQCAMITRGEGYSCYERLFSAVQQADGSSDHLEQVVSRLLIVRQLLFEGEVAKAASWVGELAGLVGQGWFRPLGALAELQFEQARIRGELAGGTGPDVTGFAFDDDRLTVGLSPAGRASRTAAMYGLSGLIPEATHWLSRAVDELDDPLAVDCVDAGTLAWLVEAAASVGGEPGRRAAKLAIGPLSSVGSGLVISPSRFTILGIGSFYAARAAGILGDHARAIGYGQAALARSRALGARPTQRRILAQLARSGAADGQNRAGNDPPVNREPPGSEPDQTTMVGQIGLSWPGI